jgi:putative Ca2+/H+ antiporter (TMEM165/GDT1 family)
MKIILGIDFLVVTFSVIFMTMLNLKQVHVITGIILLVLGTIHIFSHLKKK